jgi:hypothetical protein
MHQQVHRGVEGVDGSYDKALSEKALEACAHEVARLKRSRE